MVDIQEKKTKPNQILKPFNCEQTNELWLVKK